ncbi:MAG: hypothetical protein Q4G63_02130 [Bacteroidia bacterium]|nr:hypothetical protein [Bacteroidia bacterium]
MRQLKLTINNENIYEQIMKFLNQFDENQLQIEKEYTLSDFENSTIEEPAIDYYKYTDNDFDSFDEQEEYNPAPDDPVFLANKRYLEKIVERMDAGLATYHTFEEFVEATDAIIAKYENRD